MDDDDTNGRAGAAFPPFRLVFAATDLLALDDAEDDEGTWTGGADRKKSRLGLLAPIIRAFDVDDADDDDA